VWEAFHYCEVFAGRVTAEECERVIALHRTTGVLHSRMPRDDGAFIRNSDLFWIPQTSETKWIFERIWDLAALYNSRYGFELCEEMGQLQLTRYDHGQLYNWHMDLGAGAMSLRKISVVVELAAREYAGGGTEIFFGEGAANRITLGQGDALVFPSFVMHRALPVQSGTRWTLVSWLTGRQPLQ
jgi:PKHD-type hydroxylase